jgi:AraC family transcriptional regulator of adaptative response/methylated-DNA-[protein]-cysteine methyltransferase
MHPTPDLLYTALTKRDPAYDGLAFVGVTSTGIFCRLVCPARTPKFANTRFFETPRACLDAGFRPCLRCRPLAAGIADPLVKNLLTQLDAAPDRAWSEPDLIAQGLDPSTVRRAFKRHFNLTFLDLARRRRTARGLKTLAAGHPIIEAQMDAGYDSASGFREAINRLIGDTPSHLQSRPPLFADWLETPIGPMLAVADAHALHLLEFVDRKALPTETRPPARHHQIRHRLRPLRADRPDRLRARRLFRRHQRHLHNPARPPHGRLHGRLHGPGVGRTARHPPRHHPRL